MKQIFFLSFLFAGFLSTAQQPYLYNKDTAMIRMRDGIRLFTVIYTPTVPGKFPFMIERTPYGAGDGCDTCKTFNFSPYPAFADMAQDGYIFVFQDIRGKFKSEGKMEMNKPMYHKTDPSAIDESTDTYDTVDWLIKNISNNNGRAGIRGVSYDGWLAMVAAVDPHPALKAASEQATPADMFLGDDFHHNGAFRLSYGFEYSYLFEHEKETSSFPFPQFDLYDWYLKLGPLKNVNEKYFKNEKMSASQVCADYEKIVADLSSIGSTATTRGLVYALEGMLAARTSRPVAETGPDGKGDTASAAPLVAECRDEVISAEQSSIPRLSIAALSERAQAGDAAAQNELGRRYGLGLGIAKDSAASFSWYEKAVSRNFCSALANLAYMYLNGEGVPKDGKLAEKWYTKAAAQNHRLAQFNLGLMYAQGQGVEKNETTAVTWIQRAAQGGDATAELGHRAPLGARDWSDQADAAGDGRHAGQQEPGVIAVVAEPQRIGARRFHGAGVGEVVAGVFELPG